MSGQYTVEDAGRLVLNAIDLVPGHAIRTSWSSNVDNKGGEGLELGFLDQETQKKFETELAKLPETAPLRSLPMRRFVVGQAQPK